MSNSTVRGAGRAQWPERDWPVSSRKTEVERVDSVERAVADQRSLGPLASGTARSTGPATALTQQDFDVAVRVTADNARVERPARNAFGEADVRYAIAQYQRNSQLTPST